MIIIYNIVYIIKNNIKYIININILIPYIILREAFINNSINKLSSILFMFKILKINEKINDNKYNKILMKY